MFTGIIEEVGKLVALQPQSDGYVLDIKARQVLDGTHIGDSISVNGVCLTVVALDEQSLRVQAVRETVERTTVREFRVGASLNLERAMRADRRFGGHFVQGHVDGTGVVKEFIGQNPGFKLVIKTPEFILKYLVEKGSVSVDGVSLTVAAKDNSSFSVVIIPHTLMNTTLQHLKPGSKVNLEADILGKYLYEYIRSDKPMLSEEKLQKYGF